jgi:hypothetical protein
MSGRCNASTIGCWRRTSIRSLTMPSSRIARTGPNRTGRAPEISWLTHQRLSESIVVGVDRRSLNRAGIVWSWTIALKPLLIADIPRRGNGLRPHVTLAGQSTSRHNTVPAETVAPSVAVSSRTVPSL